MNKHNDYRGLIKQANEELAKHGYALALTEPEEGCYSLEIHKNGKTVEVYAENYYENELSDLVTDAWHHVNEKLNK